MNPVLSTKTSLDIELNRCIGSYSRALDGRGVRLGGRSSSWSGKQRKPFDVSVTSCSCFFKIGRDS